MTLLETLLAMSILSVMLVVIFGFFRELSKVDEITQYQQSQIFKMRYLEFRLSYLFSRLTNENVKIPKFYFYLDPPPPAQEYTTSPSLVFEFDNGVRLDPLLSGDVWGRLYLNNEKKQLCLGIWPITDPPSEQEMQKEILFDGVLGIDFEFYSSFDGPSDKDQKKDDNSVKPPENVWVKEWSKEYNQLPLIMKIFLRLSNEDSPLEIKTDKGSEERRMIFEFVLPVSKDSSTIFYPGGD